MGDDTKKTVYCLTCRRLVSFVEADVREREVRAESPDAQFQVVDYIRCAACREEIPLGLPRFRAGNPPR